jgi:hypothetical protein
LSIRVLERRSLPRHSFQAKAGPTRLTADVNRSKRRKPRGKFFVIFVPFCKPVLPSTLNLQRLTYFHCKTHCSKLSGDVISPRRETEADGTPGTAPARCGFGKKTKRPEPKFNQNHFA